MPDPVALDYAPPGPRPRRTVRPSPRPWHLPFAVVLLTATLIWVGATDRRTPSKASIAHYDVARLAAGLGQFAADNHRVPTSAEGLTALLNRPPGLASWKGPYIESLPAADPFGRPYVYRVQPGGVTLRSGGSDGVVGTADDVAQDLAQPPRPRPPAD